jgi:heptosyltransferase-2
MIASGRPERILVIKLADLGDLLLCEPAFRSLRTAFPAARIDVLTTPGSLALLSLIGHDLNPITFPKQLFDSARGFGNPRALGSMAQLAARLRRARYDRVVVLHHLTTAFGARKFAALVRATGSPFVAGLDNGRGTFLTHRIVDDGFGALHEAEYMRDVAVAAGGHEVDALPRVAALPVADWLPTLPERFAAIYPATGAFSRAREWSTSRYAQLAQRIRERGIVPVVVGADDAQAMATEIVAAEPTTIDLTGRTSVSELAALLAKAEFVVGGDSFIGHLAAAVGTPVVAIFGPSNADAWRPAGAVDADSAQRGSSIVVRSGIPCQPCIYTGFRLGRPAGCPDRTCLKLVSVPDVAQAINTLVGVA